VTVVVGYGPGSRSSGALELASTYADARGEDLLVVSVIPPRWSSPSLARQADAEFAAWAAQQGDAALARAKAELAEMGSGAEASFRKVDHRSPGTALLSVALETGATGIVVGSSEDARRGSVELGSTGSWLLHSSTVPVGIAPRGYARPVGGFTGVSCAVAGLDGDAAVIATSKTIAAGAGVGLRLVTFAVRLDTMFPTVVGPGVEDEIVAAAREQSESYFGELRAASVIDDGVQTVVGLGHGWRAAMDSIAWDQGDMLVLGSHKTDVLTRVFLGTNATKIVRYAPVPVVVLPA